MDEEKNRPESDGSYGTGSTRPCKSYRGLTAFALVLLIIAISVLHLYKNMDFSLNLPQQTEDSDLHFSSLVDTTTQDPAETLPQSTDGVRPADTSAQTITLQPQPEQVENVPQSGGLSLQEIYENTIDSVVSISCTLQGGSSSGTGVVLTADGYIVTNNHVIEGADRICVLLTDQRELTATVVGADEWSDLAVLYVEADDLSPATFGDSDSLRVGDAVVAIGDPLGVTLRGTMTDGIICALNRDIETDGRVMTLIQTNAALNSGNSGGPLINCFGQVIGINTMKISAFTDSAGVEGLGFAIPSTTVKEVVDQLLRQGYVSGRPSLGLTGEMVSELYQRYYRLPAGYYVTAVTDGGAAQAAGLRAGDIILSADGQRITAEEDYTAVLYAHQAGDTLELVIYRSGSQFTLEVTLQET